MGTDTWRDGDMASVMEKDGKAAVAKDKGYVFGNKLSIAEHICLDGSKA